MTDDNETNLRERVSVLESRINVLEDYVRSINSGPTLKCPVCSEELRVKEATFSEKWTLSSTEAHHRDGVTDAQRQDAKHIWFIFCTNCGYSTEVPKKTEKT